MHHLCTPRSIKTVSESTDASCRMLLHHGQNLCDILHSPNLLVPSSCLVSERTGNPEGATGPRRTRLSTLGAAILFAFLWKLCGLIAGFSSLRAALEKEGGTACVWRTL